MKLLKKFKDILSNKNPKEIFKNIIFNLFLIKPRRNPIIAKILKIFSINHIPKKWVFVVGCYNSGTTLLIELLGRYSDQISILNEGATKTDTLKIPEEYGWKRMWYKVINKVKVKGNSKKATILKKDWNVFFDKKKPIFLEKSIVNTLNMEWLQNYFPNPYFIAVLRNGYAVAEGIRRKSINDGSPYKSIYYPIKMCAKQWVISNQIIEKSSKRINNFKLIFYEDLCNNPKKILDEIYNFIGVKRKYKWNDKKIWQIQEKTSEVKNMNEFSFSNLNNVDISEIEKVAKDMLRFYNYPIISNNK